MANVLPKSSAKKLEREFLGRFILVGALVSLGLSCIGFLALLPAEIAIRIEGSALANIRANAPTSSQTATDRATLVDAQSLVNAVLPYTNASSTGIDAITSAIADRPKGIALTLISYKKGSGEIALSGNAGSSADIAAYESALRADSHFKDVKIPVGALVGGNKDFTVTLSGDF